MIVQFIISIILDTNGQSYRGELRDVYCEYRQVSNVSRTLVGN